MAIALPDSGLTPKLVRTLYTEAMLLADEARAYFDDLGRTERDRLDPFLRVTFSCESLKVTTRLMNVIAWLLTHRAVENGELSPADARSPSRRLAHAAGSSASTLDGLPAGARAIIAASIELHERVDRLDEELARVSPPPPGARGLQHRLLNAF